MWVFASSIAFLLLLYLFCLKGRTGHKGMETLRRWHYAHRGLHDEHKPENSMAAFGAALDAGFGIELDIHLMKDGNLAVIHDSSLLRTAGEDVTIEELTAKDLSNYCLNGTKERIPLFSQVLELYQGNAPLIVELKCVNNNYAELCAAACQMMDTYHGPYCMESFDPRCIRWLKKNRPDIIRGQLSENWMATKSPMPWILRLFLTHHILNIMTRPDFIAYKFCDRNNFSTKLCRKIWKVQGVTWTLKTKEQFASAIEDNWIPIFEGFVP